MTVRKKEQSIQSNNTVSGSPVQTQILCGLVQV